MPAQPIIPSWIYSGATVLRSSSVGMSRMPPREVTVKSASPKGFVTLDTGERFHPSSYLRGGGGVEERYRKYDAKTGTTITLRPKPDGAV